MGEYQCVKCKSWNVSIKYETARPHFDKEWLSCRCGQCQYFWSEDCADKKPKTEHEKFVDAILLSETGKKTL